MIEKYKEKQPLFYKEITKSKESNKLSHAYLIETNKVSYAYDLALDLVKFFLCDHDEKTFCDKCNNIDLGNYPDLKIIESEKTIKKEQMLELQKLFSVKPLYGKYMIYVVKDVNMLNKFSANTILKFLEEPSDNIIAILLTDNSYHVIDTIVSRCKILTLMPEEYNFNTLLESYYLENEVDLAKEEIKEMINFYEKLEDQKEFLLIDLDVYKFKEKQKLLFEVGCYLYFDALNKYFNRDKIYFEGFENVKELIISNNKKEEIIRKIDLLDDFMTNSSYNVNKELMMDHFVIAFSEGSQKK